jgi:hypothetical protein
MKPVASILVFCISLIFIALTAGELRYEVKRFQTEPSNEDIHLLHQNLSSFDFASYVFGDRIFFIIEFSEQCERRSHKTWIWNPIKQHYCEGDDRETNFSLTIEDESAKFADLWFWRSFISDPVGIAEDMHLFRYVSAVKKKKNIIKRDAGNISWDTKYYDEFVGEKLPRFQHKKATGSYADVSARGIWKNGRWRVLLSRKLDSGQDDDIAFIHGHSYLISLFNGLPESSSADGSILLVIPN